MVTAQHIAALLNGIVEGNAEAQVYKPGKIEEAVEGDITFLANPKYEEYAYTTQASILLVSREFVPAKPVKPTLVRVDDVYASVAVLMNHFGDQQKTKSEGIAGSTAIDESARLGEGVSIGHFTVIESGAIVGNNCKIHPQVFIGRNVTIGDNCEIHPGTRIYHDCVIGDNCVLYANAIIGNDGFGYAPQEDGSYQKIAQLGNVILEDGVEIGANTVIDRATMGSTIIKKGVKLDNLIQVAHNVEIGENTVVAAQAGFAGSAKIGKNCQIGGQAGFIGHIRISPMVRGYKHRAVLIGLLKKKAQRSMVRRHYRTMIIYGHMRCFGGCRS